MHASAIEVATGIHSDVAGAVAELAVLRALLDRKPRAMGLIAATAGIYPLACSGETRVSGSARYGWLSIRCECWPPDSRRVIGDGEDRLLLFKGETPA
jgi:gamma-glutamyl:cysteine ligase YbdK (ATP-grasp superfamily)